MALDFFGILALLETERNTQNGASRDYCMYGNIQASQPISGSLTSSSTKQLCLFEMYIYVSSPKWLSCVCHVVSVLSTHIFHYFLPWTE